MKIPYTNYIKVLIAAKFDFEAIADDLEKHSLALPPKKWMDALHKEVVDTNPDWFSGKQKEIDTEWLEQLGVDHMYGYKFNTGVNSSLEGVKGGITLLNDRLMYRLLSSLALGNVGAEDIELILNGKYDVEYASTDVDMFLRYFFTVDEWTYQEKKDYIGLVTDHDLRSFYELALQGDKSYLMWKLGVAPDKSFDNMLREMFSDSYYNFKEYLARNPDMANKFGALAIRISERLDKIEKESNDKSDMFNDISFALKGVSLDDKRPSNEIKSDVEDGPLSLKKKKIETEVKKLSELN